MICDALDLEQLADLVCRDWGPVTICPQGSSSSGLCCVEALWVWRGNTEWGRRGWGCTIIGFGGEVESRRHPPTAVLSLSGSGTIQEHVQVSGT